MSTGFAKGRFPLMLASAGLAPLLAFGAWSFFTLRTSVRATAVSDNARIARLTAGDVRWNLTHDIAVLKSLSSEVGALEQSAALPSLLASYATRFPDYYVLGVADQTGAVVGEWHEAQFHLPQRPTDGTPIDGVTVALAHGSSSGAPSVIMATPIPGEESRLTLLACLRMNQIDRDVRSARAALIDNHAHVIVPGGSELSVDAIPWNDPGERLASGMPDVASGEFVDMKGVDQLAVSTEVPELGWRVVVLQPLHEAMAPATRLAEQLALAIVVAVAAAIAFGFLLSRRLITSVRALQHATQAIASGDFAVRVPTDGAPETTQLATSFNTMADKLDSLQQDVKSQERQVVFGRVVAGLFHDLAHPIQNIENNVRLLMRDDLDDEGRRSVRGTIAREFSALRRFMDDVLDVARPAPIERTAVDVNGCVAEVVDAMRAEAERSQIDLEPRTSPAALFAEGDQFALSRVLRNLIANAIHASGAGHSVVITTRSMGDSAELQVADRGIGIAPDRLRAIFDDFTTTKRRGLGLGLAISKRIVEQMGGAISVESEVGRGTTFTVRLHACEAPRIEAVG